MTAALLDDLQDNDDTGATPPVAATPAAVVAAIAAAVDQLLAADLTLPPDTDIIDLLRGVEVQSRRLHAASVRVTAQITDRGLAAPAGASSTAALLRQLLPLSARDAYHRVRLAAATNPSTGLTGAINDPALPLLAAALHGGSVGPAHAGIIVSTLTGFPAAVPPEVRTSVEEFLVEQAAVLDPKTFHNVARRIALMANPDGPYDERDAADKQQFHIGQRRDDGLTRCWGLLDDLTVETLRSAFGAMCAPAADRNRRDTPDTSSADASSADASSADASSADVTSADASSAPGAQSPTSGSGTAPRTAHADTTPDDAATPEDTASQYPEPEDIEPHGTEPEGTEPADTPAAPAQDETADDPRTETGAGTPTDTPTGTIEPSDQPAPRQPAPRQPWRASRPPYEWAPLGTAPGDYPPPEPSTPDQPPPDQPTPDQPAPPADRRSAATRRAHALGAILTAFLNSGTAPTIHGEKPHLLITVAEADLRQGIGSAQLGYGDTIPIAAARMLACDATVIPAVLRGPSEVIDIGRGMRTFTAACRKAILLRDIGCTFPGCPMPGAWCDQHHIQHWADGGPSDLDNAALLCRRHHTLIHRGQWQIRLGPDRTPDIIPPTTHDPTQQPLRNTMHRPPTFTWPATP